MIAKYREEPKEVGQPKIVVNLVFIHSFIHSHMHVSIYTNIYTI